MQKLRIRDCSIGARVRDRSPGPTEPRCYNRRPMANIKSQIKRNRQNERRRLRNKAIRTELKTAAKKVRAAFSEGDADAATSLARAARQVDKAASKGAVHKRAAARRKSRMARAANAASASS
jgi:small subunit ribosomal protein S20